MKSTHIKENFLNLIIHLLSKKIFKVFPCSIDLKTKFTFINLYFNRLIEATNYQLKEVTKQDFDFTKDEIIIIDDDQKKWQKSKLELTKSLAKDS